MTLQRFLSDRTLIQKEFERWMRSRIPDECEMSHEGWNNLFVVWEALRNDNVSVEVIDRTMQSMAGGWYTPKSGG
jgi:hypothetical protein